MPLIEWNEDLSVGIDAMDAQHKKWIEIINKLDELMLSREGLRGMREAVRDMEEYTIYHFGEEEKLMEELNFQDLANHKKIHESFKKELLKLKEDLLAGEIVLGTHVMKKIISWLQTHIMNEDKKYGNAAAL